jgi:hypothetical protein
MIREKWASPAEHSEATDRPSYVPFTNTGLSPHCNNLARRSWSQYLFSLFFSNTAEQGLSQHEQEC